MSKFLIEFMNFALHVTKAERALAVDATLKAVGSTNVDPKLLSTQAFSDMVGHVLTQAVEKEQAVITNNVVTNPLEAPKTNTSFSDLRIVVGLPIKGMGAIYLDRPVKLGVITRDQVERLIAFALTLIELDNTNISAEQMQQHYAAITK
jgi:hypothetical protein